MPFKSEKQRRYLWANEPEIARDWTDTYGSRIEKNDGGITRVKLATGMSPMEAQARGLGAQHHGSPNYAQNLNAGNVPEGGGAGFVPGIGIVKPQTQIQIDANNRAQLLAERKDKKEKESIFKKLQRKAIMWDLKKRLRKKTKSPTYDAEAAAYGVYDDKIKGLQKDLEDVKAGTFTQTDYTEKYGSGDIWDKDQDKIGIGRQGEDVRGLTNIITPYAAHAVGGTTQQPSMATQWYASLGSGPSNPGAFNLTQQYAAAKTAVSQRLGTSTSVGQLAVNNSPFYNWLKDNSLNKGIL